MREIHVTIESKVSQYYATLMIGRQFLTLQFVYLGHCRQEGLPGWIAKLLCVVVLTYPLQQGVVPTASVVIGVVPSNTGNQGRSKSKEPRNPIPAGTERATLVNQYVPIILLCKILKSHYYASLILVISYTISLCIPKQVSSTSERIFSISINLKINKITTITSWYQFNLP
jgi:hypothetical protein